MVEIPSVTTCNHSSSPKTVRKEKGVRTAEGRTNLGDEVGSGMDVQK